MKKLFGYGKISFRSRMSILIVGLVLAVISLFYTNSLAGALREKEQNDVRLWVTAMERVSYDAFGNNRVDPFVSHIVSTHNNIPFILTDENLRPIIWNRISEDVMNDPEKYRRKINELTEQNTPRNLQLMWSGGHRHIIFYGRSALLSALYYFPYVQWLIIAIFILFTYIALQSTKQDEQNRVWIGLAKETAQNQQIFPQPQEFDLGEQLCECLLGFEDAWEKKNLEIETDIQDDVRIKSDSELLSLVWNNLISNAVKFTPEGGTVSVTLKADGKKVFVSVRDTGCGMTAETGKHIFEKFYQGDTSHATQGNGLGLALVKRVVDILGGEIAVQSVYGQGSTFTVSIRRR